jgi:hypothetical protein
MKFSLLFLIVLIFEDIGCINPNNVGPAARAAGSKFRKFDVVRQRNREQLLLPIRDAAALRPDLTSAPETGNNSILLKFCSTSALISPC